MWIWIYLTLTCVLTSVSLGLNCSQVVNNFFLSKLNLTLKYSQEIQNEVDRRVEERGENFSPKEQFFDDIWFNPRSMIEFIGYKSCESLTTAMKEYESKRIAGGKWTIPLSRMALVGCSTSTNYVDCILTDAEDINAYCLDIFNKVVLSNKDFTVSVLPEAVELAEAFGRKVEKTKTPFGIFVDDIDYLVVTDSCHGLAASLASKDVLVDATVAEHFPMIEVDLDRLVGIGCYIETENQILICYLLSDIPLDEDYLTTEEMQTTESSPVQVVTQENRKPNAGSSFIKMIEKFFG